jgi:hypothetical protein
VLYFSPLAGFLSRHVGRRDELEGTILSVGNKCFRIQLVKSLFSNPAVFADSSIASKREKRLLDEELCELLNENVSNRML